MVGELWAGVEGPHRSKMEGAQRSKMEGAQRSKKHKMSQKMLRSKQSKDQDGSRLTKLRRRIVRRKSSVVSKKGVGWSRGSKRRRGRGEGRVREEGRVGGKGSVGGEGRVEKEGRVRGEGRVGGKGRVGEEGRAGGEGMIGREGRVGGEGRVDKRGVREEKVEEMLDSWTVPEEERGEVRGGGRRRGVRRRDTVVMARGRTMRMSLEIRDKVCQQRGQGDNPVLRHGLQGLEGYIPHMGWSTYLGQKAGQELARRQEVRR